MSSYYSEQYGSSETNDAENGDDVWILVLALGVFALVAFSMCFCFCYCVKKDGEFVAKQEEQKLANAPTVPPPMDYQNQRKCQVYRLIKGKSFFFFQK